MEHKCSKTKEIDKLTSAIFGNGKKGLITITQGLVDKIEYVTQTTESINADIKVLLQFQTQVETREVERHDFNLELEKVKESNKKDRKWRTGLIISTILSLIGVIITLYIKG